MKVKNLKFNFLILIILVLPLVISMQPSAMNAGAITEVDRKNSETERSPSSSDLLWGSLGVEVLDSGGGITIYIETISDGQGGVIVAWTLGFYVYLQKIDSQGNIQWAPNGVQISNASDSQEQTNLISDGEGGAIITWIDQRSGVSYDIFAHKVDSEGNLKWAPNGTLICNATDNQGDMVISSDGQGGAIIAWEDNRNNPNTQIFAQRIDSNGNIKWATNGTRITENGLWENNPEIASDGQGGAIIAWQNGNDDEDIYAQRLNSSGNKLWGDDGVEILDKGGSDQLKPVIVADGQGGAIIAWEDGDLDQDIVATRVNSTGDELWAGNGVNITKHGDVAIEPKIICDGQGGAIIAWKDNRYGSNDVFAQSVNSTGDVQWTMDGVDICTDFQAQQQIELESDGVGGAIIVWEDRRSNANIYAQHINKTGVPQWAANGTLVMEWNSGALAYVNVISDGVGGAIIVCRGQIGTQKIIAQRINTADNPPTCSVVSVIDGYFGGTNYINYTFHDDIGGGDYRIWVNGVPGSWLPWEDGETVSVQLEGTSTLGENVYRCAYTDSSGNYGFENVQNATIYELKVFFVEIVNDTFTEDGFEMILKLLNGTGHGVPDANIQYLWNGINFTGNSTDLTGGLYRLNFTAITVAPGDPGILLNMTINKTGYTGRIYERYIAVDPEAIDKDGQGPTPPPDDTPPDTTPPGGIPGPSIFLIGIVSVMALIYVVKSNSKRRKLL